jgi:2-polyprenyl-6-methoxyphenol hydroxylase-like FAD-dependent oxidoreductase
MKVLIVGGGPAGLFLAYMLNRMGVAQRITIVEQNPPDATYGFGITVVDHTIRSLSEAAPDLFDLLNAEMVTVRGQLIRTPSEEIDIDFQGHVGSIERMTLLAVLRAAVSGSPGIELRYNERITDLETALGAHDLVVGADGANSQVREAMPDKFGVRGHILSNHFAWYGVDKPFACATLDFRSVGPGTLCGHYYRYTETQSTFVAECDEAFWTANGFCDQSDDARASVMSEVFSDVLDSRPLITNRSVWRQFAAIECERWVARNAVLIGDAGYAAHYSIGSGTRLALEDALALASCLQASDFDVGSALQAFEQTRRPEKEKLMAAARRSYTWYDRMSDELREEPLAFAYRYLTRTGRIDPQRLRLMAPQFARRAETLVFP